LDLELLFFFVSLIERSQQACLLSSLQKVFQIWPEERGASVISLADYVITVVGKGLQRNRIKWKCWSRVRIADKGLGSGLGLYPVLTDSLEGYSRLLRDNQCLCKCCLNLHRFRDNLYQQA